MNLNGKSVLITGGTGSLGNALTKKILESSPNVKRLVIFSRDEQKQFQMGKIFPDTEYPAMRYFIGDVRDYERLLRAFQGIDYVIHAAAMKHVPVAEYNPDECIKTNVIGAQNVVRASLEQESIKSVVALSTDKACSPINLYGASKLCADKLFVSANNIVGKKDIKFSVVRYGNVMGSRGSVLPEFLKQQKKQNFFTITDKEMTRFNISLKEAVDMVLWSLQNMYGGEIIIPKIKAFKITDLARAINNKMAHKIIGIRDGEKKHEELINEADSLNTYSASKYYVLLSQFKSLIPYYKKKFKATKVNKVFKYSSNTVGEFLSINQLKKIINKYRV